MHETATEMTKGELLLLLSPTAHFNSVYRKIGMSPDGDAFYNVGGKVFHLAEGYVYPDFLKQAAADQTMELSLQTAMPLETMEKFRLSHRAIAFNRLTGIWSAPGTVFAIDPRPASAFPGTKAYRKNMNAILASPP